MELRWAKHGQWLRPRIGYPPPSTSPPSTGGTSPTYIYIYICIFTCMYVIQRGRTAVCSTLTHIAWLAGISTEQMRYDVIATYGLSRTHPSSLSKGPIRSVNQSDFLWVSLLSWTTVWAGLCPRISSRGPRPLFTLHGWITTAGHETPQRD